MSAKIHNLYLDFFANFTKYLNEVVLETKPIKKIQYTLGNESLNLTYDGNYELPMAILTTQTPKPYNNRTCNYLGTDTLNTINLAYNCTKDFGISCIENLFILDFNLFINCETQIQAINIHQKIQNWFRINRPVIYDKFYTWLKIDDYLKNPYYFDFENDDIVNIGQIYDSVDDSFELRTALNINPILTLTDIQIDINDPSSQIAYQITTSWEAKINIPVKYINPPYVDLNDLYNKNNINNKFIELKNQKIAIPYNKFLINYQDKLLPIDTQDIGIEDINNPLNFYKKVIDGSNTKNTLNYSYNDQNKINFVLDNCSFIINNEKYSCKLNLIYSFITETCYGKISDYIDGTISNINFIGNNILQGIVVGYDYVQQKNITQLINIVYKKIELNNDISISLDSINKYSLISNFNIYNLLTKISKTNTILTSIYFNSLELIDGTLVNCNTQKQSFSNTINFELLFDNNIKILLSIHQKTGEITKFVITPDDTNIIALNIDTIEFNISPIYGSTISDINIDIGQISNQLGNSEYIEDSSKYNVINIICSDLVAEDTDFGKNILLKYPESVIIDDSYWKFIYNANYFTNHSNNNYFKLLKIENGNIYFQVTLDFYYKYLTDISKINPIILNIKVQNS